LLAAHWTYREIADHLGVSHGTVGNDAAAIREEWKRQANRDFDAHVAEELAKLDQLERSVVPEALAGAADQGPLLPAVDRELAIMRRRAKLLGLDRPMRVESAHAVEYRTNLDTEIEALLEQMRPSG
jgi:hypothetical protein